jgi:hypothetical protein
MKTIRVMFGSISLSKERDFDFLVFEKNPIISESFSRIQRWLDDGRFVTGVVSKKSWYKRLGRLPYWLLVKINTKEKLKFVGSVDESTKKEVLEKILTRRCFVCGEPTIYQIFFPISVYGNIGHSFSVCLDHLNKTIREEKRDWKVLKNQNDLLFGKCEILGRVFYNSEEQKFGEEFYLERTIFIKGKIFCSFSKKTGILEIRDQSIFEDLKNKLEGISKEGVQIDLPIPLLGRTVSFGPVKSLEFVSQTE